MDNIKAGERISYFRKANGLTQEELAEKLGITPQAVSKWENDHTMPDTAMLPTLSQLFHCSIDSILMPSRMIPKNKKANYEYVLLPYDSINKFTGLQWPRSMADCAMVAALKLFFGLEQRRDYKSRQINDDEEYIIQAGISTICFGYSYVPEEYRKDSFLLYGLDFERIHKKDYNEEEILNICIHQIQSGYPFIVERKIFGDKIIATGVSTDGVIMRGLSFLDGDDKKNSKMSFKDLRPYDNWVKDVSDIIVIKPADLKIDIKEACIKALGKGYKMLSNTEHKYEIPLKGYGLVIYDNWIQLLTDENNNKLHKINCLMPHIYIHYEAKLRTNQFLKLCMKLMPNMDEFTIIIVKYQEIIELAEEIIKIYHGEEMVDAHVNEKRLFISDMLKRSQSIEADALQYLDKIMKRITVV